MKINGCITRVRVVTHSCVVGVPPWKVDKSETSWAVISPIHLNKIDTTAEPLTV